MPPTNCFDKSNLAVILQLRVCLFKVSDKLGQLYSQMIFMEGFVHSDPHPGNILVTRGASGITNLVLLDHGLYAVRNYILYVE